MDPKKNAWMGLGSAGAFGWPGLFAQRSGKAPRMPGIASVQGFQKEAQAALAKKFTDGS
jgi:hypothetical protein